ncbi:dicarboxylate--CoA ligase PimA [Azospirillum baldaniorum]|uniref:long-chain-fatty-acid--CoA ligase n=1 Tax=Azospirillum baldaniorum TaxID=1064539 RepID=UPI000D600BB3|nr:long-chain fatty acid--CoA ligase [Azospirillum baldaniorum]AWJ89728.1 dicarboxylate--CoA ligase PimA [Azospirillum baldaniorum]TWA76827.1 long-chain acyl-CoA synthetase [Azospirillum brasilense]
MTENLARRGGIGDDRPAHPWLVHYPEGIAWDQPIPVMPLAELFEEAARRYADRPCLDFLGRRYRYAEVLGLVNRAAKGFATMGVKPGVRVGLCLPNTPTYVIAYFAILKAGGTVVNYNPLYVERELEHQIEDSGTEIMVTLDLKQIHPRIEAMLDRTRLKTVVVCRMASILSPVKSVLFRVLKRSELASIPQDGRHVDFDALLANDGVMPPVRLDPRRDVAVLQYTGGTTGVPKGAMLTHANLVANARQVQAWFPGMALGKERMLAVLPFFHVFAMTVILNMGLAAGAELVMLPRFDTLQVLKTIARRKPTLLPGVPTMYKALLSHPDVARHPMRSIRYCISGGAPLPMELKRRFEEATGCVLVEGYGLSEASPVCACNPLTGVNKEGSIGLPLPGIMVQIRALDDPDRVLPPGEKGQVVLSGPNVMAGYWNKDEESRRTIVGGWLFTGDVGVMDEDGYVFLLDRLKDLILCGGYNVYPRVIEEAIYHHPDVVAVCVIGVPDDYRGQSPKAFVQLKPDASLTAERLKDFLRDKISRIEMPKLIEFRAELPKTAVGKLSKKELIAESLQKPEG